MSRLKKVSNIFSKILIFISVLFIASFSCKDKHISFVSKEKHLIQHKWKINSFEDNVERTESDSLGYIYEFFEDGTLIITKDTLSPRSSTWEFLDDKSYLRIGANIYKLIIITKKLLGLQYGTLEIYYVPVE